MTNLIEQLGGYEKAKEYLKNLEKIPMHEQTEDTISYLPDMLLEYRRQHNIYEVGDKVVYRKQCNLIWDGVYDVDVVLADGRVIERDLPTPKEWLSHATDKEIAQGYRDE